MATLPRARARQLQQLEKFDPASYQAARIALRGADVAMAIRIIAAGMQSLLSRLTGGAQSQPKAKRVRCGAYLRREVDGISRQGACRKTAVYTLIIKTGVDTYPVVRCQACRDRLQAKIQTGATFEILAEETVQ